MGTWIFSVRNHVECGAVLSDRAFNEVASETSESVFVGDHNLRDASCFDELQKGEDASPLEVEP